VISLLHLKGWERIPEMEMVALGNRTPHRAQGLLAEETGVHAIGQKPLCDSLEDARGAWRESRPRRGGDPVPWDDSCRSFYPLQRELADCIRTARR
jgi:hypothetical protein